MGKTAEKVAKKAAKKTAEKVTEEIKEKVAQKRVTALQLYTFITLVEVMILVVGSILAIIKKNPSYCFDSPEDFFVNTEEGETAGNLADKGIYEYQSIRTAFIPLEKGVYRVSIDYEGDSDASVSFDTHQGSIDRFVADSSMTLLRSRNHISYRVWANDRLEEVGARINPGEGKIQINRLSIAPDECSKVYSIVRLLGKLLIVNLVIAAICFRDKLKKHWTVILSVATITFLASLGITARYLTDGYDLQFHLLRIFGLSEGLRSGQFPVRVQPNWNNGWGYAVSAMYGDLLMLLPAGMYMAGFDLQISYKAYIVFVNFLTTVSSAYAFGKIAKDKKMGLVISAMYVLAPYRLMCIYTRTAVGEYTAFIFFPMIILGFWYAFAEKVENDDYGTKFLAPVLGFTGLMQTHILSCYMIGVCLVALLVINLKKVFRKKTFIYLCKLLGYTIWVNLYFLIPFIGFSHENFKVFDEAIKMDDRFPAWGISLVEMFSHNSNSQAYYNWEYVGSLSGRFSTPLNTAFLLVFIIALGLVYIKDFKGKRSLIISMVLAVFSGCMTLFIFPYSALNKYFPKLADLAYIIRLPFRFLGMTTVFLGITACLTYRYGKKFISEKWIITLTVAFLVLTYDQSIGLINNTMYNGTCTIYRSGERLDDCNTVGEEYLYMDSHINYMRENALPISQGTDWKNYTKEGLNMFLECENTTEEAYIDLPALNYPGYSAKDENGQSLELINGDNHAVRVLIPKEYQGKISVKYQGLWRWRIFDVFSIIGFVFFALKEGYIRIPVKKNNCKSSVIGN